MVDEPNTSLWAHTHLGFNLSMNLLFDPHERNAAMKFDNEIRWALFGGFKLRVDTIGYHDCEYSLIFQVSANA